jgi:hypothetical protein
MNTINVGRGDAPNDPLCAAGGGLDAMEGCRAEVQAAANETGSARSRKRSRIT